MYNNEQKNEENFWISYADLMAGLLFVFILVLGAIVIKYVYTQANLEKEKVALNQTKEELIDKNEILNSLNTLIKKLEDENTQLSSQLNQSNETVKLTNEELQKLKDLVVGYEAKDKEQLEANGKLAMQITLKEDEPPLEQIVCAIDKQSYSNNNKEFDSIKTTLEVKGFESDDESESDLDDYEDDFLQIDNLN